MHLMASIILTIKKDRIYQITITNFEWEIRYCGIHTQNEKTRIKTNKLESEILEINYITKYV